MYKLSAILLVLSCFYANILAKKNGKVDKADALFPNKEFSIEFTPALPTTEVLQQHFMCNGNSRLKELNYLNTFETKISCNDWTFKETNTSFNITFDNKVQNLDLINVKTFTAHVNGQLIFIQRHVFKDGVCKGGKLDKLVFNMVDDAGCEGTGVNDQATLHASLKITGGPCEATCLGNVNVHFTPSVQNTRFLKKPALVVVPKE